jgi:hypothetical protein
VGRPSLLSVGVDRLNEINDAFTHTAGDRVLIAVADRIVAAVGDRGPVARTADNELSVLLQDPMARSTLLDFIAELQAAGSGPVPMGAQDIPVTVASVWPLARGSPLGLLRRLHRDTPGEESGGNRWEFANRTGERPGATAYQTGCTLLSPQARSGLVPASVTLPDGRLRVEALLMDSRRRDRRTPTTSSRRRTDHLIVKFDGSILRQALEAIAWIPANLHVAVNLWPPPWCDPAW